jgi:hypothetical protein
MGGVMVDNFELINVTGSTGSQDLVLVNQNTQERTTLYNLRSSTNYNHYIVKFDELTCKIVKVGSVYELQQANYTQNVNILVQLDTSYRTEFSSSTVKIKETMNNVQYPFSNKWGIRMNATYAGVDDFDIDLCTEPYSSPCIHGSVCVNEYHVNNHHKNFYHLLEQTEQKTRFVKVYFQESLFLAFCTTPYLLSKGVFLC